jgi:serine/threonine protein kinase
MAAEQTGRMNRSIDARSDLCSLGVTFYEMLTGTPPFGAADPMERVQCHSARQPVPPASAAIEPSAAIRRTLPYRSNSSNASQNARKDFSLLS